MKVISLYKRLGKLIEEGYGHKAVCINKDTFKHPLEGDGIVIIDVKAVEIEVHNMADDDGGFALRKDGSEILRTSLVIKGGG